MAAVRICPACETGVLRVFWETPRVPVICNIQWASESEALAAPVAPMRLGYCGECGMIYNAAFDPSLLRYDQAYENAQHYSRVFQEHADGLVRHLLDTYALRRKAIVEIACGDGAMLARLCQAGDNRGTGFDPAYNAQTGVQSPNMQIFACEYTPEHTNYPVDFLLCRQFLEHVAEPLRFLRLARAAIGDRKGVSFFFGVPNGLCTFRDLSVWDILYEHCSYFTPPALRRLFVRAGFGPLTVRERYFGQFLDIEGSADGGGDVSQYPYDQEDRRIEAMVNAFADAYDHLVQRWRSDLFKRWLPAGRTVIWGAGTKGIMFLNALGVSPRDMSYAVDINPRKHGRYLTGTGQRIIAPEELKQYRPEVVLLMNPAYKHEVRCMLEELGLNPKLVPVWEGSGVFQVEGQGAVVIARPPAKV